MKITFVQAGGTIDKNYPRHARQYHFEIAEPAFKNILHAADPNFECEFVTILQKDSLDMTDDDRQKVLETCRNISNDKIIVTHGTDTMVLTARALSAIKNKTIVLTGAMEPEIFKTSDAGFNLGVAVGALNVLGNGVYVAMNGRVYAYDKCDKDPVLCRFVEK